MSAPDVVTTMLADYGAANGEGRWDMFEEAAERMVAAETDVAQLRARVAALEAVEAAFFKLCAPDGFHQCGMHEECPECEQETEHAPDCKLAAALSAQDQPADAGRG